MRPPLPTMAPIRRLENPVFAETTRQSLCGGAGAMAVDTRVEANLDASTVHWNTSGQVKLKGLTPEEFRDQALEGGDEVVL